jgi:hypothetical protein
MSAFIPWTRRNNSPSRDWCPVIWCTIAISLQSEQILSIFVVSDELEQFPSLFRFDEWIMSDSLMTCTDETRVIAAKDNDAYLSTM